MSIWRNIWKESIEANTIYAHNEKEGEKRFSTLFAQYGEDGMIYYARAEAYEYKKDFEKSILEYKKAKQLFPVQHWKDVAQASIDRVERRKPAEKYFNLSSFNSYLWYLFQKTYEFVNLDSFVRYVCVSAISRASSEWPLSLIDFRTILELEVSNLLPQETDSEKYNRDLRQKIDDLEYYGIIKEKDIVESMHWIRKNGNKATHNVKSIKKINEMNADEERKELLKLKSFYAVMEYLNSQRKK